MPDRDGYPTKDEVEELLTFTGSPKDYCEYVNSIWWHNGFYAKKGFDSFSRKQIMRLTLSTWGWSGNEEMISQLQKTWFWFFWWTKSERGGHFTFEIPIASWHDSKGLMKEGYGMPHALEQFKEDYKDE